MRRQRNVVTLPDDLLKRTQQLVGTLTVRKPKPPVTQGLATDADGTQTGRPSLQDGFQTPAKLRRLHRRWITPGHQQIGHLRVMHEVIRQAAAPLDLEFQLLKINELRPTKAVGTVGMTGLSVRGE
jgi:hypothetical protein